MPSIVPRGDDEDARMYHLLFFFKHGAGLIIWRGIKQIDPNGQRGFRLDENR